MPLRAGSAWWDPARPEITATLSKLPEDATHTELVALVRELDRRFVQLWDKVAYERNESETQTNGEKEND